MGVRRDPALPMVLANRPSSQPAGSVRVAGLTRRCVLLLFALIALTCVEDPPALDPGTGSVTDPRTAPRITYVYPPLDTFGPYTEWDRDASPSHSSRMEIRFNKIMNVSSVRRAIRIRSSVHTIALDTSRIEAVDEMNFFFYVWDSWPQSEIGEVLTLSLASPVYDFNSNAILPGDLGTITPEPEFRVRRIAPEAGTPLQPVLGQKFELFFNSNIDSTIMTFLSVLPSLPSPWAIGTDSLSVRLPMTSVEPSTAYEITLRSGAADRHGRAMEMASVYRYPATPFDLWANYPSYDTVETSLTRQVALSCAFYLDPVSVSSAVHISPDVPGGVSIGYPATGILLVPIREFEQRTRYVIRVDTTLRTIGGDALRQERTFSFTTGQFRLSSTSPADGEQGVYRYPIVSIRFTGRLDSATIPQAFSISPPVDGTFADGSSPDAVIFRPGLRLLANTTYTVEIDSSIRSVSGYRIGSPYSFTFTTGK